MTFIQYLWNVGPQFDWSFQVQGNLDRLSIQEQQRDTKQAGRACTINLRITNSPGKDHHPRPLGLCPCPRTY